MDKKAGMNRHLREYVLAGAVMTLFVDADCMVRGAEPTGYYTEEALARLAVAGMPTNEILLCFGVPDSIIARRSRGGSTWAYSKSLARSGGFRDGDVTGFVLFLTNGCLARCSPVISYNQLSSPTGSPSSQLGGQMVSPPAALAFENPEKFLKELRVTHTPSTVDAEDRQHLASIIVRVARHAKESGVRITLGEDWEVTRLLLHSFPELRAVSGGTPASGLDLQAVATQLESSVTNALKAAK